MSWHPLSGNKGMIVHDLLEALLMLILVNSFLSDSDKHAGVEKLAFTQPNPKLYTNARTYPVPDNAYAIGHQQIDQQKGWTRSVALYFIFYAVRKLDILTEFKAQYGEAELQNFGTVYGIVSVAPDDVARVDSNLNITMASTMTRQRPNAFNFYHQVKKKVALGISMDRLKEEWTTSRRGRNIYNIGVAESSAVANLINGIPAAAAEILQLAACKWGVVKGPMTHAGIGCEAELPMLLVPCFIAGVHTRTRQVQALKETTVGQLYEHVLPRISATCLPWGLQS